MKNVIFILGMLFVISCTKTEAPVTPPPVVVKEETIKFNVTPNNDNGTITVSKDTLNLSINISSKVPDNGMNIQIECKRTLDDKVVHKIDSNSKANKLEFVIPSFGIKSDYTLKVTVSSKSNTQNADTKTIQIVRNRIITNFLKPSYDLSNVKIWQEYPAGYATVPQVD